MADTPEFDPNKPFEDVSAPASSSAVPEFDPNKPFEDASAPKQRGWYDRLTDPFTDIGPEIAKEATDAWSSAKENLTTPPEPGVTGAVKNLWETTKGMGNALRVPFSPVTGTARSLIGHPMADLEQAVGENVVTPAMEYLTGKKRETPLPTNEQLYEQSKKDVDLAMSAIPANRRVPTAAPAPTPATAPFGVTLSEAERTGDLGARQFEQAALRGQSGRPAQEHATEFFNVERPPQVAESRNVVSRELDPYGNQVLAETPAEAAELAQTTLQRESARSKAGVKSLYDQAKALPGEIAADTFTGMPQAIKTSLSNRPDAVIIDNNTPVASRMMDYLDNQIGQLNILNKAQPQSRGLAAPGPAPIVGVNLEGVEQWRKNLSRMRGDALAAYGTNPSDARAASAVINEFDDMIAHAVNSGAFRGDPRAVDLFNDARAAHAARMKLWGNDAIGRKLQNIIGDPARGRDPASLNDVANWMYSASGTSPNSTNIGMVRRIRSILGPDSPEWAGIKQGMLRRLINEVEEGIAAGPGTVATRLNKFLNGSGSDMAAAMFTASERNLLQEYANLHRQMAIPLQGANWSNTGAATAPFVKQVGDRIVGAIGALIGHHISPMVGGLAGYAAGERLAGVMRNRENARNLAQATRQLPIIARQFQAWQQAVRSSARQASLANTRRVAYTAGRLANGLQAIGLEGSAVARVLAQSGPQGPGTSEAEGRARGGGISTDPGGSDHIDVDGFSDSLTAGPDRFVSKFADGGVPTFDERFRGTSIDDPSPDDMIDNVSHRSLANNPEPDWKEAEARANLAAQQAADPPDDGRSFLSKVGDAAKRFTNYDREITQSIMNAPSAIASGVHDYFTKPEGSETVNALTGEWKDKEGNAHPRYQTWPEKVVRSGASLAHDAMTGEVPQWSIDPKTGDYHTNPEMVERAQDMAGLAGSGGLGGVGGSAADMTLGSAPFLRPALKYEGKVYKAPTGGQHLDALPPEVRNTYMRQALNGDDISNFDFGFMNHKGQFLNREAALDYAVEQGLVDPATARQGALTTDNLLMSDTSQPGAAVAGLARAEPFYSAVERSVQNAPQPKMQGEQWANWLKNQPGVKPDELEWTGVDSWLRDQKGPVTKEQVQDHLNQNKVELKDVTKGKPDINKLIDEYAPDYAERYVDVFYEDKGRMPNPAEMEKILGRVKRDMRSNPEDFINFERATQSPRYNDWQLPGGENYREHLLTLPQRGETTKGVFGGEVPKTPEDARLSYFSRHWEEPNVLAHVRTNERDVGGVPSLHLEEIQSDWHQQGRKQGYKLSGAKREAAIKEFNEVNKAKDDLIKQGKHAVGKYGSPDFGPSPELQKLLDRENTLSRELGLINPSTIPDAPFKTAWPELALKRMIRMAAEEGKDRVSWTPGEAQAARYNLSNHYSEIGVVPEEGNFFWWPRTTSGHGIGSIKTDPSGKIISANGRFGDIEGKNIADVVGKEIADKGLGAKDETHFRGLDLKVGGEGMRGFYDKMLPKMVEKLGKQYGVKVKKGSTGGAKEEHYVGPEHTRQDLVNLANDPTASRDMSVYTKQSLRSVIKAMENGKSFQEAADLNLNKILAETLGGQLKRLPKQEPVYYFDIPEKMKHDVLTKGQPLFSETSPISAVNANDQRKDVSRPVQHQKDESEINVPERAAGGRVVLSNINHSPSEAQKHAGNYAKEHIRAHGLDFTIENARGKERSGTGKDGKRWSVKMPAHYGYIKRTEGADGDHVDVYMGPHMHSKHVFVINQVDADTKKFDEHKCCFGMRNLEHALKTYESGFSDGRGLERIGSIVPTTISTFKHWLKHGDTRKPFSLN